MFYVLLHLKDGPVIAVRRCESRKRADRLAATIVDLAARNPHGTVHVAPDNGFRSGHHAAHRIATVEVAERLPDIANAM